MYLDSPKDSIDNLLELIREFGKTVKYKIKKKSVIFLYNSNKYKMKKKKLMIPFDHSINKYKLPKIKEQCRRPLYRKLQSIREILKDPN